MHTKPIFSLLAAAALLLGGCHSTATAPTAAAQSAAAPVTDSSLVLTPAEISAVVGVPIDDGKHPRASGNILCSWYASGVSGEDARKLVLNFASQASFQREEKAASPRIIVTPASGIGDEAFYVTTGFGTSLYIRKGDTAISFSVHESLPTDQLMAKEKVLGLKAAGRL